MSGSSHEDDEDRNLEDCAADHDGNPVGDYFRQFIFQQDDIQDSDLELSAPRTYGVATTKFECVRIKSGCGEIGAWFLAPETIVPENKEKIMLYLHGVKGTRGRGHRVFLYNRLLELGYRVLTIDYRGFGDSTDSADTGHGEDEDTVVEDARAALAWLRSREPEAKLFVWGHSMGTGIATHALAEETRVLGPRDTRVAGLVLEAPYNNFTEEFIHVTSKQTPDMDGHGLLRNLYEMSGTSVPNALLREFKMEFNSDQWIMDIQCPILILHAVEDEVIPLELGRKLYRAAQDGGNDSVYFFEFGDNHRHSTIHGAERLGGIIDKFCENAVSVDFGHSQSKSYSAEGSAGHIVVIIVCVLIALLAVGMVSWFVI